jgi:hypothetical protein
MEAHLFERTIMPEINQSTPDMEKALSIIPVSGKMEKSVFTAKLRESGLSTEKAKSITKLLHANGDIHEWFVSRPKGQPGGKLQYWSLTPQPEDASTVVQFAPSGEVTVTTVISGHDFQS